MSDFGKIIRRAFIGAIVASTVWGCGSASNNDQGTSFLGLGFFSSSDGDSGDSGAIVVLSSDVPNTQTESGGSLGINGFIVDGLTVTSFVGVENRLTSQFIRTTKVECSYDIPGADPSLVIPDDSYNFSTVVPPAVTAGGGTTGVPLTTTGSRTFTEVEIVSPDIFSFLNNNRNLLPELPFRMTANCAVTGVAQGGDSFVTNPTTLQVQFFDAAECCTGFPGEVPNQSGAFPGGVGSGGSFDGVSESDFGSPDGAFPTGSTGSSTAGATGTTSDTSVVTE